MVSGKSKSLAFLVGSIVLGAVLVIGSKLELLPGQAASADSFLRNSSKSRERELASTQNPRNGHGRASGSSVPGDFEELVVLTETKESLDRDEAIFDWIGRIELDDLQTIEKAISLIQDAKQVSLSSRKEFLVRLMMRFTEGNHAGRLEAVNALDPGEYSESILWHTFSTIRDGQIRAVLSELETVERPAFREKIRESLIDSIGESLSENLVLLDHDLFEMLRIEGADLAVLGSFVGREASAQWSESGTARIKSFEDLFDPEAVRDLAQFREGIVRSLEPQQACAYLVELMTTSPDPAAARSAHVDDARSAAYAYASYRPQEAAEWSLGVENAELRAATLPVTLGRWLGMDPIRAGEWVTSLSPGEVRDEAIAVLVRDVYRRGHVEDAAEWIESIAAEKRREDLRQELFPPED